MVNIFGNYSIFTNADNEIMVTVLEQKGEPIEPCILYDGGDHAILYRSQENGMILDYIDDEVKTLIKKSKQILIAELPNADAQEPTRSYFVPVKVVSKMPDLKSALPNLNDIEKNPEALKSLARTLVDNGMAAFAENKS
ncbi:MAG: hypothetical protein AB7U85_02480 [Alphaproteobacteria bacterium]